MSSSDDFGAGFLLLTGRAPYGWQRRLHAEMLADRMPTALDLPTGLGKTSVMAIWLLARAAGAPVPRRLVYVVDRRAVVDQASAEAEAIAIRLTQHGEAPANLRAALHLGESRLPVSTLHGQLTDNRAWLQRPEGVAIIVGTVDMVGSRLLFSGYGVSRRMRPVQAALMGADSLIVLDEAHLVPPFEALLKSASELGAVFQRRAPLPVAPLRPLSLSATGRATGGSRFVLTEVDRADAPVAARLNAVKRLKLHAPLAIEALAETMASFAQHRAGAEGAVVVFCNSRKVAQAVSRQLQASFKKADGKLQRVELLVGERRVRERAVLAASPVFVRFSPERHRSEAAAPELRGPAFLVATSAGEVGVDLDADHLVCDLVPWERMVQRLGRVNRRPLPADALADVFPALQKADKDVEQAVVDLDRLAAPFRSAAWPRDAEGRLDASPGALLGLRELPEFKPLTEQATSEAPLYPPLTLAHLQAWAMTSLERHPGRTLVAPWLRGWVDAEPQCRVAWRTHLPVRHAGSAGRGTASGPIAVDGAFMLACLPHLSETLEAPAWRVAEWLKARAKAGRSQPDAVRDVGNRRPVCVVVLDGDGDLMAVLNVDRLVDGDAKKLATLLSEHTVIVDARLGGLDENGLLDHKADSLPRTLDSGDGDWTPPADDIGWRVRAATADGQDRDPAWQVQATWAAQEDAAVPDLVVEVRRTLRSDAGDPALAKWAQRLDEHQSWAGRHARAIAAAFALPADAAEVLGAAARVHDEGKRRAEWQRAIGMRPDAGDAWAKSGRRRAFDGLAPGLFDAPASAWLMAGYRHEFGSVGDARTAAARLPSEWRDLFLHLIAAHHGFARPTIHPHDPAHPPTTTAALAQDIALRYAALDAHWGPWALAWWETLLKAADWHASAELNALASGEDSHG